MINKLGSPMMPRDASISGRCCLSGGVRQQFVHKAKVCMCRKAEQYVYIYIHKVYIYIYV